MRFARGRHVVTPGPAGLCQAPSFVHPDRGLLPAAVIGMLQGKDTGDPRMSWTWHGRGSPTRSHPQTKTRETRAPSQLRGPADPPPTASELLVAHAPGVCP